MIKLCSDATAKSSTRVKYLEAFKDAKDGLAKLRAGLLPYRYDPNDRN